MKITPTHLQRTACAYIRPSSASQVENNRKSTDRQYTLITKDRELGWFKDQVTVIDEDHGLSGADAINRNGFTRLTEQVAMYARALYWG